ncbi:MAG: transcription termination factor Rho [candidate division KSB1 bacterium]|nr:transcription termination factor Rho [candidate division KSB1 bacterium]
MSESVAGVYQHLKSGSGFLRSVDNSFQPGSRDVWVSRQLTREFGLQDGATIIGTAEDTERGLQLREIESICGLEPVDFKRRTRLNQLVPIDPLERIKMGESGIPSMRIIELIAPIGKGTRGMIVSPPKAGKTRILEELANSIAKVEPETRIIVLLIDERPEEVTHFRRGVRAEVLASSSDQSIQAHVTLAEMAMGHIRCELECGRDIVVLVDSITRLARAFNSHGSGSRRTMSGGLDAQAMQIPRQFFGLARNIENGGSVTVIATALVETGSRMDDLIFEEFKGTGNSEVVLNRRLSEERIFPAIDIVASGTRKEQLLYTDQEMESLNQLNRAVAKTDPKTAMLAMNKLIKSTKNNAELIEVVRKKGEAALEG